jgi:hypothetical protein
MLAPGRDLILTSPRRVGGVRAVQQSRRDCRHGSQKSAASLREYAEAGWLVTYGVDFRDLFRRSTVFVDNGAKLDDLPVEQPTKFELVVNLKTTKALGIAIPSTMLARADEMIE